MSKEYKISLTNDDWDDLLPSEEYIVGKTKIYIKPLGLESFSLVLKELHGILSDWQEVLENDLVKMDKKNPKSILEVLILVCPKIASLIQAHATDIISEMSNIRVEDIKRMPPKVAIDLFNKCLEVNIESQRGLEKNFDSLVTNIVKIIQNKPATTQEDIQVMSSAQ